jgi:hypothetical protein
VYEQSDVFVLTSEYEGMPVGLLEAMGRGCVPVVSDIRSGVPELVRDGENGYRVPPGDTRAFARHLSGLQTDPSLRRRLSAQAFDTVRGGPYRVQDMAAAYADVITRAREAVRRGEYRRPLGKVTPPPFFGVAEWLKVWIPTWLWPIARRVSRALRRGGYAPYATRK